MDIKKTLILILTFLLLNISIAYPDAMLIWQECVRLGAENNPELISAREKIKQAKSDKDVDLSTILPQVDAGLTSKRAKTAPAKVANAHTYSLTGQQLVFDGFKTTSEIAGAYKTIRAQQYNYDVVSSNVRLDLKSAFVGLMKAQELVAITESIASRRKQNLELVKLRYESGREHKGALLTAEADMAQAEFESSQAKRSISVLQRELSKALGLSEMNMWRVKGEFSPEGNYGSKPDFVLLAQETPFLRELIMKKEAARFNVNSKAADFLPKVYLNGTLGKTSSHWPIHADTSWSAGVSVSLPIFEGGSRIAETTKAKSQLEQAKADERSGYDSVLVTLENTWKDLEDAIVNVAVQKKFLDAAQERAKITKTQYETGLASFNDWIIIENNLVSARKSYLGAQAEMLLSEAYWIQAIGGTLENEQE